METWDDCCPKPECVAKMKSEEMAARKAAAEDAKSKKIQEQLRMEGQERTEKGAE
ncbi:hypothetical protein CC86DRAFT_375678 [Ophiobolus disseminans]|uniref:Uncharacterized protein n=1 Tax=Ophiobolus disseminans TaxID=1469910 RepID=A0A6A6ZEC7_9PLEO|nr:hypothetical protein CC86DRAFT_375678 [Ophiobolus disseminans]